MDNTAEEKTRSHVEAFSAFFNRMEELFAAGQFERVAEMHVRPVAIYSEDGLIIADSLEKMTNLLRMYSDGLKSAGIEKTLPRLCSMNTPLNGRVRCELDWVMKAADGKVMYIKPSRYFLVADEHGIWRIEMIEHVREGESNIIVQAHLH